ncbi:MAG: serine dehydratase subunit alpha family protein [Parasporobacterium sp.]|nr:serine dehydratase subunit alpha family protein [Parasporobacterium sp.]
MGCTEPIAIAYTTAVARKHLGEEALSGVLYVSPNIVKNVKSVTVPHTDGMVGLKAAFAAGLAGGNADSGLEVLSDIDEGQIPRIKELKDSFPLEVEIPEDAHVLDCAVRLKGAHHTSYVRLTDSHTNIVLIERDGETVYLNDNFHEVKKTDRTLLNVEDIVSFAETVNTDDVKEVLDRQIQYNMAIANEGMKHNYGANIGKILLRSFAPDIKNTAMAYAAAGSDARMNGCELPVIINSGSGNQGITASVPVIIYARDLHTEEDKLYRALCISNLITIHLKTGIGPLSAYCGAVSAGAGAACGIAYLQGCGFTEIAHCLVNALAVDSGIICDGAKASCAAKIATAVETGLLGLQMHYNGSQFYAGEGIIKSGVEDTIKSVSRLASRGMRETDKEIIRIMLEEA